MSDNDENSIVKKQMALDGAMRLIGKEYRKRFTGAIQLLNDYVCPRTGDKSQSEGKAYIAYTKMLNKRFGLSKEQAEAHAQGENLRDQLGATLLHSIALAEEDAASEIYAGIKSNMPRSIIKDRMREAFERHADNLNRIKLNYAA